MALFQWDADSWPFCHETRRTAKKRGITRLLIRLSRVRFPARPPVYNLESMSYAAPKGAAFFFMRRGHQMGTTGHRNMSCFPQKPEFLRSLGHAEGLGNTGRSAEELAAWDHRSGAERPSRACAVRAWTGRGSSGNRTRSTSLL